MKGFVKFVVVVGLLGFLGFELGSPVWSKTAASSAAQEAAGAAAQDYFAGGSFTEAKTVATTAATERGATVTNIEVLANGDIEVWVSRPAKSYLLHDVSAFKNWYNVKASATAGPNDPLTS